MEDNDKHFQVPLAQRWRDRSDQGRLSLRDTEGLKDLRARKQVEHHESASRIRSLPMIYMLLYILYFMNL